MRAYLPPGGVPAAETLSRIIGLLDPWPLTDEPRDDWVAQVISSGPHDFPLLKWRSAEHSLVTSIGAKLYTHPAEPVDMVLFCPACGLQHIDAPWTPGEFLTNEQITGEPWTNPPHRSHLCAGCGHQWRPADIATNGVQSVKTEGADDTPPPLRPCPMLTDEAPDRVPSGLAPPERLTP